VQVDPIKPTLKPPGTKRLKVECGILLLTPAFKFNFRRYNEVAPHQDSTFLYTSPLTCTGLWAGACTRPPFGSS